MGSGSTRPVPKKCNHNVLSNRCSYQPYIKVPLKKGQSKDKSPDGICAVCGEEYRINFV